MSRNRPLTKPEDGVCPVTGLDVPDDGDGQLVKFPEKKGKVITRQMVKINARETPQSALLNVIKVLACEVATASPDFKGFDTTEAERWHSTIGSILDCLSDRDYESAEAHLRQKGFLCRIES